MDCVSPLQYSGSPLLTSLVCVVCVCVGVCVGVFVGIVYEFRIWFKIRLDNTRFPCSLKCSFLAS